MYLMRLLVVVCVRVKSRLLTIKNVYFSVSVDIKVVRDRTGIGEE